MVSIAFVNHLKPGRVEFLKFLKDFTYFALLKKIGIKKLK